MRNIPIVALIYDFDGTLSPGNMQEFGFIQAIGKKPREFWEESDEIAIGQDASNILSYMKLMFDEAREAGIKLRRSDFKKFGKSIELFDGVKDWFRLINAYGRRKGVKVEHYINSSGLAEMIEGTPIAKEFKTLRAILNKAVEAGLMQERNMPANLQAKVKETATSIVGLEDWELQKIEQADLQTGSHLWNARNLYLFAMYAQGMRLGDALQLRWQNIEGDRLRYQMDKVDKPTDIKVLPVMQEILDLYRTEATAPTDYIFPYLNNTAIYAPFATYEERQTMPAEVAKKLYNAIKAREHKIDIAVKELAEVAGVRRFTFHTGRHSFAMKAIDKGVDAYTTMKMLNHSSLAVTERYLNRLNTEKEDTALQKIFGEQGKLEQATKLVEALKGLGLDKETIAGLLDR